MMSPEQEKIIFLSQLETELNGLEFQRQRVLVRPNLPIDIPRISPVLDADLYMVLLHRLYRHIVDDQHDSRVANLKGKYRNLVNKIKIRHHFEHGVDTEMLPSIVPGIKVSCGLVINPISPHIISGDVQWFLNDDHSQFLEMMREFTKLYPYAPKQPRKTPIFCRVVMRLYRHLCKGVRH